ncbi:uncharacterized protein RJT21DRAFT_47980 [Scheffersomyces amazonensis]|uniref:uncharacterized protein n=1 Tax=Scheffersomyces amazonensis TaxID=1078765 RepID=UPI00315CAFB9
MSSTHNVTDLIGWLNDNAYWREDLIVKESKYGGLGVFMIPNKSQDEINDDDDDDDPLLLRIPKTNTLSPKNSTIYNLLLDYEPIQENIDLTSGMFGVIISVIYEVDLGDHSPWYDYLNSIDFDNASLPICLWDDNEKLYLKNTELDLRNLLSPNELIDFFIECTRFAKSVKSLISIPKVLNVDINEKDHISILSSHKTVIHQFGKIAQSVISRAFTIDDFYDQGLVPGADLFNHIEPTLINGKVKGNEHIHFVCDAEVCIECGEVECDHMEVMEDDSGDEHEDEDEDDDNDEENQDGQEDDNDDEEGEEEPITEITMEYIQKLEQEEEEDSDADTNQDPEEISTFSEEDPENVDDEDEGVELEDIDISPAKAVLAEDLADSSKCCDVLLVAPASEKHDNELFNSYGNDLSNYLLLQRYGFITDSNVNDVCLLAVQLFTYISGIKTKSSKKNVAQLEEKLSWLDHIGLHVLNHVISDTLHNEEDEHEHEHDGHGHEHDDHEEEEEASIPESWSLACGIMFSGSPTPQTYAILKLVDLPYRDFKDKLLGIKKENVLIKRVRETLLELPDSEIKAYNQTIRQWCAVKLSKYSSIPEMSGPHRDLITSLIKQEKAILSKFIEKS